MTRPTDAENAPPPLRISRTFHARRATVFAAWTSADHVARWFAPEGCTVSDVRVEPVVGGAFELRMRSPAGEHAIRGRFVEIAPPARLVIDMTVSDATGKPLFRAYTEADFSDAPGGTRLDLVQSYTLLDPAVAWMVQGAPEGWRSTLDNLDQEVRRMSGAVGTQLRSVVHGSFQLQRHYDAPVERVWRALTDATAKQTWFSGPPGEWEPIERHMDVREGGRERAKGRWRSGMVSTFDAIYHDVVPHARLVYSYVMHLDDKKISVSLATMQLRSEDGGTTLIVAEQGAFLDGYDDAGSREHGTGYLLDRLAASLHG